MLVKIVIVIRIVKEATWIHNIVHNVSAAIETIYMTASSVHRAMHLCDSYITSHLSGLEVLHDKITALVELHIT